MDPIFGLPCTSDSRAMELARTRNHIADKMLARKFEALDLAQRNRSGKFLTRYNDLQDFLTSIDSSSQPVQATQSRNTCENKSLGKKSTSSMSVQELDKKLLEVKGMKMAMDAASRSRYPSTEDNKVKSANLYKENTTVSLVGAFDDDTNHIVGLEQTMQSLSICRKKQIMRDAFDRATSDDMQHKRNRTNAGQVVSSARSRKLKS